jgi:transcriptional regulator with XRE-family HTH domain
MTVPKTSSEALLRNLTGLLASHGITQAEFARRAGVPATTLNRVVNELESGLSPRLETVESIAKGFGITVSALLAGEELPAGAHLAATPNAVARQLSRLVEDFLYSDEDGKMEVLRAAEQAAAAAERRRK